MPTPQYILCRMHLYIFLQKICLSLTDFLTKFIHYKVCNCLSALLYFVRLLSTREFVQRIPNWSNNWPMVLISKMRNVKYVHPKVWKTYKWLVNVFGLIDQRNSSSGQKLNIDVYGFMWTVCYKVQFIAAFSRKLQVLFMKLNFLDRNVIHLIFHIAFVL